MLNATCVQSYMIRTMRQSTAKGKHKDSIKSAGRGEHIEREVYTKVQTDTYSVCCSGMFSPLIDWWLHSLYIVRAYDRRSKVQAQIEREGVSFRQELVGMNAFLNKLKFNFLLIFRVVSFYIGSVCWNRLHRPSHSQKVACSRITVLDGKMCHQSCESISPSYFCSVKNITQGHIIEN